MPAFATVEDLKRHLGKTSNADDDELQDHLDAASERVRDYIGTSFDAEPVTERLTVLADGTALLSRRDVVGDVVLNGGDITGHTLRAKAGMLTDVRPGWRYPVTATYTTSGGPVPASVMLATLIIAAHLWETQRGTTLSPLSQQDVDMSGQPFGGTAGFAIPNRAKELLEPFIPQSQIG